MSFLFVCRSSSIGCKIISISLFASDGNVCVIVRRKKKKSKEKVSCTKCSVCVCDVIY